MTDTAVTKFDPLSYVDKIRDKIKQSLIDVIPDDQWNAMLKTEISSFFEARKVRAYNHATRNDEWTEAPSEFHGIVLKVLQEVTKDRIKQILAGPEWQAYWDGTRMKIGEEIGKIARDNGAAILSKWLEAAIGQVISSIRFQQ